MSWPSPPPTRIISFQQLVIEADPYWNRDLTKPWIYEFSNRRLFYQAPPLYTLPTPILWDGPIPWDTPDVMWGA